MTQLRAPCSRCLSKTTESDLNTALDIAEGIVAAIFVHIPSAYDLSNRVPRRTPSGKIIPWKRASDIPNEQRTKNEETLTGKKKKEATNSRGGINNFD